MAKNLGNLFIIPEEGVIIDKTANHVVTNVSINIVDTVEEFWDASYTSTGVGKRLTIPDSPDWDFVDNSVTNATIDFWLKHTTSNYGTILAHHQDVGVHWRIDKNQGSNIRFYRDWGNNLISSNIPIDTEWHHHAITKSGNTYTIYTDGVYQDSAVYAGESKPNAPLSLFDLHYSYSPCPTNIANFRFADETLWTTDFEISDEGLLYVDGSSYVRPDHISEFYSAISSRKGNLRGKAKQGFIRPTIKQFFTSTDFEEVYANFLLPTSWDPEKSVTGSFADLNRTVNGWDSNGLTTLSVFGTEEDRYYWEIDVSYVNGYNGDAYIGISRAPVSYSNTTGGLNGILSFRSTGDVIKNGVTIATGLTNWENDSLTYVVGVALNANNQTVQFWVDGASQGIYDYSDLGLTGPVYACIGNGLRNAALQLMAANFGQSEFTYSVPAGYTEGFGGLVEELDTLKLMNLGCSGGVTIIDDLTCICGGWQAAVVPIVKDSGKWYLELNNVITNSLVIGVTTPDWNNSSDLQNNDYTLCYSIGTAGVDRIKYDGGDGHTISIPRENTDTIGIAYDAESFTFSVYKNGVYVAEHTQNTVANRLDEFVFAVGAYGSKTLYVNAEPQYTISGYTYLGK